MVGGGGGGGGGGGNFNIFSIYLSMYRDHRGSGHGGPEGKWWT